MKDNSFTYVMKRESAICPNSQLPHISRAIGKYLKTKNKKHTENRNKTRNKKQQIADRKYMDGKTEN